jgi:molybdopterin converting factor small subunit
VRIHLKLFAIARQRAGSDSVSIALPDPARVSDLRSALADQVPALASLSPSLLIAIDSEYARDDSLIPPDSEIAAIPPVSGGGGSPANREEIET